MQTYYLLRFLSLNFEGYLWIITLIGSHIERLFPSCAVCYAIRKLSYFLDIEILRMVYFANSQSVTDYSIIFWGNSTSADHIFCSKGSKL